ncbi:GAF domain-containing protein [Actinoplanes utahensis]|uniref:GAF domain-containing protein n=1 Tax=Actinoplanes utahensis TaxID=1869 RepID=A0A0A6UEN0_ACTUT|nr:GAF domain-containing protein [Actinoplanes utahensis]KHD74495.1 hypothetical protein MB27_28590 [Actinoplanes utahensis]GIF31452.1 hypothetical protein Aut01nite_44380 [Actinoplanes utahensis]
MRGSLTDWNRLAVIGGIDFEHPEAVRALDAIAEDTARRTGVPLSLATLVLNSAQLVAGASRAVRECVPVDGTPNEWSLCARIVISGEPFVVTDAAADPRTADSPAVTMAGLGSYAGVPVVLHGATVGAHCLVATAPQVFTDGQLAVLHRGAAEIAVVFRRHAAA